MLALFALSGVQLASCGAASTPTVPMASETSPVVEVTPAPLEPIVPDVEPPPEPLRLEVRAPGSMMLQVVGERDLRATGELQRDGEVWRWALTLDDCALLEWEPEPVASGGERCATFAQRRFDERAQVALRVPAGAHAITLVNLGPAAAGGLWIRDVDDAARTALSAGGATQGVPIVYEVELAPGRYRVSGPLTPTPDYLLIVDPSED